MKKIDNELLNHLQSNFPLVEEPFLEIGSKLSISESDVIKRIEKLKKINYIRQISAIFDTRSMKYKSSLIAMSYDDSEIDSAAQIINQHPGGPTITKEIIFITFGSPLLFRLIVF